MSQVLLIASTAPSSITPALYIFGALLTGGALTVLTNLVRQWRRGQLDDTEIISRITKDTVAGAKDLLSEYRLEVEIVKRQVEDYRVQLYELTKSLAEANFRIQKLEEELHHSGAARAKLMEDLREAIEERKRLTTEIERLHEEITSLLEQHRHQDVEREKRQQK